MYVWKFVNITDENVTVFFIIIISYINFARNAKATKLSGFHNQPFCKTRRYMLVSLYF